MCDGYFADASMDGILKVELIVVSKDILNSL